MDTEGEIRKLSCACGTTTCFPSFPPTEDPRAIPLHLSSPSRGECHAMPMHARNKQSQTYSYYIFYSNKNEQFLIAVSLTLS